MTKFNHILKTTAVVSAAALALTACADADSTDSEASGDSKGELTLAVFNGWEEGVAVSELWHHILEEEGYDVTLEYADPAPVFSGLATGDYDVNMDVWLPITHASYIDEYGEDIVELGTWNDESELTIAVNEDAPIQSLDELAENADEFGNRLVGIEPGAGLTETTTNEAIPTYGLEDMEYITSSTPAMLQELTTATENGENIVVTLWRPHWAYEAFPIRDLEDPEGAMGGAETMNTYARSGFEEDFPEVAQWLSDFEMDSDLLYDLENVMFNESDAGQDEYGPIIEEWVAENQEYVDGLTQ